MRKLAVLFFALIFVPGAHAQDAYPAKGVRLVAAAAPGGNPDVLARMLAAKLAESFGRPFVVENLPGAGGVVAAEQVARAPADGYTLMLGDSGALAINVALNPKLTYHPLRDFTLITALAAVPTVLVVNPRVAANSLQEFVALGKSSQLAYGSAGNGSVHHLTMAVFLSRAGVEMLHVPYKGGSALVDAGCRYVHIDEPGYTAYVDEPSLAAMRRRGEDPQKNLSMSLKANAQITHGFDGVTFGIHLCRGNQRSMWHREGAYDAIAERLFNELPHRRFLLEYDSPRAGGFAPLRFVPKGKVVVLGLVSTKVPELETVDLLKKRIDEATKYLPLEQLAISPQCGFGSDVSGNLVSEDDQRRKLELVVEVARQVWS